MVMNKKGSEMIEAAIVLPIFLIMIVLLIHYGIFSVEAFRNQIAEQEALITQAKTSNALFTSFHGSDKTGDGFFERERRFKIHAMNQGLLIRLGTKLDSLPNLRD